MSSAAGALVERDSELSALHVALEEARAGRGSAILVEGEAGIGKSTLLESAGRSATAAGMRVLDARATTLETAVAYGVARQLLLPALLEEGARERLLTGAAALAGPALLGPPADAPSAGEVAFASRHGLTWLVAALAENGPPLALLADDVHWADAPSVRFLAALSARAGDAPVALIVAARPAQGWPDPALAAELAQSFRAIRLARLSAAGVGTCLLDSLGVAPDPAFTAAVHVETAGTPYLVAALARALRNAGVEPTADGVAEMRTLDATEVARDVGARMHGLSPDARDLVSALAVVGDGRAAADAVRLAGLEPDAAARAADALEGVGLVHGWPEPAFDHPLVPAALLDGLGPARRGELHARAAEQVASAGELERAAAHLAEAPGRGDGDRVALLRTVAGRALGKGAADVGARHLRRALAEPPPAQSRAGVLLELGLIELSLGQPEAADRLMAAARAASDPEFALRAQMTAGHALTFAGLWEEGFARMKAAIAAAGEVTPDALALARLECAGTMLTCVPTGREASGLIDELDRHVAADAPIRGLLDGVVALRDTVQGQPRSGAIRLLGRSSGATAPGPAGVALAGARLITVIMADLFEQADVALDAVIATGRHQADVTAVRIASAWAAFGHARRGRLAEAEEAALGVDDGEGPAPPIAELVAASARASVALERGDLAAAARIADTPFERDPRLAPVNCTDDLLVVRGHVRLAQGDPAAAAELFARAGASQTRWGGASPPVTQWRLGAAHAALALGDTSAARELVAEEVVAAERFGAPRPLSMALCASARTSDSQPAAERALRDALDCLDGERLDLQRARVCADLGELLAADGDPAAGRNQLRIALDLAWACGADALAERARAALAGTGSRPRGPRRTGLHALTAAEARTARMAVESTNREIAETLFVTEKTIESQLTAAYRKLGIAGRGQLAAALGADQRPA